MYMNMCTNGFFSRNLIIIDHYMLNNMQHVISDYRTNKTDKHNRKIDTKSNWPILEGNCNHHESIIDEMHNPKIDTTGILDHDSDELRSIPYKSSLDN